MYAEPLRAILAAMKAEFADPKRDALSVIIREEVSSLGALLSDAGRPVAILAVVVGDDGRSRAASLLTNMDEGDRALIASELIRSLELEFGRPC